MSETPRSIPARLALGLGLITKAQYQEAMATWQAHPDLDAGVLLLENRAIDREALEILRQLIGSSKGVPDRDKLRTLIGGKVRDVVAAAPPPVPAAPPAPKNPWVEGALVLGRYQVVRSLGKGSMGEVIMAFDKFLNRQVAIKAPHAKLASKPAAIEALRSEVALAHAVNHPNIARTFDLGEAGGLPFVSMEFIEGCTLQQELDRRGGKLAEPRVREIAHYLCAALEAAHANGVVHRDLKPANVMLTTAPRHVIVMDFGIAAATEQPSATMSPSASGGWQKSSLAGTPAYMAPEQWRGEPSDARTDIYQLGVLLFRLLAGKLPFEGTVAELRTLHSDAVPPALRTAAPEASMAMAALVERLLAKSPAARPTSMGEVARALEPFPILRLALHTAASIAAAGIVLLAIGWTMLSLTRAAVLAGLRPATARLADIAARGISPADLGKARSEADLDSPEFQRVHAYLTALKRDNPEVKFLYTLRQLGGDGKWEFAVDADPRDQDKDGDGVIADDEKGSPPGLPYDGTAFPAMDKTLRAGKAQADLDFAWDDWGFLLSGYAPIVDPASGERYIVGVDVGNEAIERFKAWTALLFLVLWVATSALAARYWWLYFGGRRATRTS